MAHNKQAAAAWAADFYHNDVTPRSDVTSADPGTSRRPHSAAATTHRVSTRPPEGFLDFGARSLQLLLITARDGPLLCPAGKSGSQQCTASAEVCPVTSDLQMILHVTSGLQLTHASPQAGTPAVKQMPCWQTKRAHHLAGMS